MQSGLAHVLCHRGFQSAETKVGSTVAHAWSCELHRFRIPFLRQLFNDWPAGISEPKEFCNFIKRLAGGVVARAADDFVFSGLWHKEKICVTAGNDYRQRWMFDRRILKTNGID